MGDREGRPYGPVPENRIGGDAIVASHADRTKVVGVPAMGDREGRPYGPVPENRIGGDAIVASHADRTEAVGVAAMGDREGRSVCVVRNFAPARLHRARQGAPLS